MWLYLTTWGFRTLNDMRGDGIERPNADDLGDLFAERIHERGVVWHPYDGRGPRGSLSTDHADRLAEDAAHAVIRDWSPTWRDEQAERGRRGGSKSKRRPEWERDTSKLDALAALMADEPHLTVPKLADRLGVSPRTITNMRTVLRNRDA